MTSISATASVSGIWMKLWMLLSASLNSNTTTSRRNFQRGSIGAPGAMISPSTLTGSSDMASALEIEQRFYRKIRDVRTVLHRLNLENAVGAQAGLAVGRS